MATSKYQMDRPDAVLDLSCMNISCNADVCICDNGEWTSEKINVEKTVTVNTGICALDVDPTRHQLPVACVKDVEDKCGCLSCGESTTTGEPGVGLDATEVTALIEEQAPALIDACLKETLPAMIAEKS